AVTRIADSNVRNPSATLAIYDAERTIRGVFRVCGMSGGGVRSGWIGRLAATAAVLALMGCGITKAPSPGDTRITELMSNTDRARLAALAQQRIADNSDPDQGYKIGPDDLLE